MCPETSAASLKETDINTIDTNLFWRTEALFVLQPLGEIVCHSSRQGLVVICLLQRRERCQLNCLVLKRFERLRVDAMTKLSIVLKQDEARFLLPGRQNL